MARLPAAIPVLTTARLRLRPFARSDAPRVQRLAGDADVSRYLLHVPHPYPDGLAETWIASHRDAWAQGHGVTWAVTERGEVAGAVSLRWVRRHDHAELGYWLGRDYWGRGLAVEAGAAAIDWGFAELACERVFAQHLDGNARSARVLVKLGMTAEGVRRHHIKKAGCYHDTAQYGILRAEHRERGAAVRR